MTHWIVMASLVTSLFAAAACSSKEPASERSSGSEVGDKVEKGADDAADAVEEAADDTAEAVDEATE